MQDTTYKKFPEGIQASTKKAFTETQGWKEKTTVTRHFHFPAFSSK